MQIMYVCTGNQCRSVMAEYYPRAKLADRGIGLQSGNITVRSAGTLHYPPHPADPMVIDLLKNDGEHPIIHRAHHRYQPASRPDSVF